MKTISLLMRKTVKEWLEDGAASIAAALAYYAIFSLSPLLIITALVVGTVIGPDGQEGLLAPVEDTIGEEAASTLQQFMETGNETNSGFVGNVIWITVVVWGASGLFAQLQNALNKIWEVKAMPGRSPLVFFKNRLLSFFIVAVGATILLGVMLVNTFINISLSGEGVSPSLGLFVRPLQLIVSMVMTTVLFTVIFKVLPDVIIAWKDVIVGAAFTAALFLLGQFAVGFYLSNADLSLGGVAGSLTIILVWIYYSAQILLFGAEFTEVWARYHGASIRPDEDAVWINEAQARREAEEAGVEFVG